MLDIKLIRKNPRAIGDSLLKRGVAVDLGELLAWDERKRTVLTEAETLKAKRNEISNEISRLKREKQPADELIARMQSVAAEIKTLDSEVTELEEKTQHFLERLPNLPDDDVPAGGKQNNKRIREWGARPEFDFDPADHVELVGSLGLVDYKRGVKLGGSGNWLYKGRGALMEWGLLNYFVETHVKNGYEFVLPPHILTYECGYTAGQFPKFEDDVFHLESKDEKVSKRFILPTAETALVNYHRDEILLEDELPKKYFSYTPCYRKEAGSYRTAERGMIRGHQFNKVEMFQFTHPDRSDEALEELIEIAEHLVRGLGLHYQLSLLAAADVSSTMAKTYDIEVWIPSMGEYKEVSSASNARDYQARRGKIRYKRKDNKKNEFVHSLNASGLATSRLIPAIVEQFQRKDGSVVVPEPLRRWVGKDVLQPA